jgi:hypothetical protein
MRTETKRNEDNMKIIKQLAMGACLGLCLMAASRAAADPYPFSFPFNINIDDRTDVIGVTYPVDPGLENYVSWLDTSPPPDPNKPEYVVIKGTLSPFDSSHTLTLANANTSYQLKFTEPGGGDSDWLKIVFTPTTSGNNQDVTIYFASDPSTYADIPGWVESPSTRSITEDGTFQSVYLALGLPLANDGHPLPIAGTWPIVSSPFEVAALDIKVASDVPDSGNTLMLVGLGLLGCALLKPRFA